MSVNQYVLRSSQIDVDKYYTQISNKEKQEELVLTEADKKESERAISDPQTNVKEDMLLDQN